MTDSNWDPSAVRAYLLARMPLTERTGIEHLLATDPDYALFFTSIEEEVVMDYVRGRLTEEEKRLFEQHYPGSSEHDSKIRFARALALSLHRERRRDRQRWMYAWVTSSVILALGIWFFYTRTVTVDLYAGVYRGAGQMQTVKIGRVTAILQLRLHSNRRLSPVTVNLRPIGATEDSYSGIIEVGHGIGVLRVPVAMLRPGEYVIETARNTPESEAFLLDVEK